MIVHVSEHKIPVRELADVHADVASFRGPPEEEVMDICRKALMEYPRGAVGLGMPPSRWNPLWSRIHGLFRKHPLGF